MTKSSSTLTEFILLKIHAITLSLACFAACSPAPTTPPCVVTTGTITVDGQPTEGVMISLHPTAGGQSVSRAVSGPGGEFTVSTYAQGDGAPPGEYQVTCIWGRYDAISRDYVDDRLEGKFNDPKESEIVWELGPDGEASLRRIELKTR